MTTLIILDGLTQDQTLGIEIDRMMTEKGWERYERFSFAYVKHAQNGQSPTEAEIKSDVDASTFQAEWKDVKYLYQIGTAAVKFDVSPGL